MGVVQSDVRPIFDWVAAESSVVKNLRRYLSGERQVPRDIITFMAYWSRERQQDL